MRPQLVLISAGFDAHRDDPIGSLDLETEDFGLLLTRSSTLPPLTQAARSSACSKGGITRQFWPAAWHCTSRTCSEPIPRQVEFPNTVPSCFQL